MERILKVIYMRQIWHIALVKLKFRQCREAKLRSILYSMY
jgi:hypothetical protein